MNIEIERKFLVVGDFMPFVTRSFKIEQGYLCTQPEHTVRVRIKADKAFLTIKGNSNNAGVSRFEWEKEIEMTDALDLLDLCGNRRIAKTRHIVPAASDRCFEIDVFHGRHRGLVIAEIELESTSEEFYRPQWLGREVTGEPQYYNAFLSTL